MKEKFKKSQRVLILVFLILISLVVYRLINLQIVKGTFYDDQSRTRISSAVRIPAPRGEILDRYGRPLVTNKTGFSVEIQKSKSDDDLLNRLIINLVDLFEKNGEEYIDNLEISYHPYEFKFYQYDEKVRNEKIAAFSYDETNKRNLSPAEMMEHLCEKYNIDNSYTNDQKRKIAGVRYEMEYRNFSASNSYTFASDISVETLSVIKEQSLAFPNVYISTQPLRDYENESLAAHVLGRVGKIYKEEYEVLADKGYSMNAIIGKDGMEKYLEPYIRGKDGTGSVERTFDGANIELHSIISPVAGNNAILTLDLDLQKTAEKSLKEIIENLYYGDVKNSSPQKGSVVAMDVNTGEILAIASYPTYNPKEFDSKYLQMYNDPLQPMFNRAISGTYAPGSVFKMLTSVAALEERIITPNDRIYDRGVFKLYDQSFNCWLWSESHGSHGNVNVSEALKDSCNYFYYDVGNRLGIEKLSEYAMKFGLGSLTGIEIEGEAKGVLATPEYKEKTFDTIWYPGDTVQCAIGQSFSLFTPLQLTSYISTLANGGTRYKAHLLKSIKDSSGKEVYTNNPKITGQAQMSKKTYDAVAAGMRMVAKTGTASKYFADFPVEVACKTGTAQVGTGDATGVFTAYAPFDNPQIAVCVVVENAGSGGAIAPIAKDVFAEYFGITQDEEENTNEVNTMMEE